MSPLDMDYRCSSSVAGLALLIGGSCALLAPASRAGDRIDFSAPAIPLSVPHPEVQIKETSTPISSTDADVVMDDAYNGMVPPQQVTISRTRKKDKDPWDTKDPWETDSLRDDDSDPRTSEDLLRAQSDSSRVTNGVSLNMQRGWDSGASDQMLLRGADSALESGHKTSRFDAQNEPDKNFAREENRVGSDDAIERKDSLLFKAFSRDPAAPDRSSAWGFTPFTGDSRSLTGADPREPLNKVGLPTDAEHALTLPAGYGSYAPVDNRQNDEQAGGAPGYMQAWEPPVVHSAASKSYSNPGDVNPSRVVAPNRPVNLPWVKRPGDPNPF